MDVGKKLRTNGMYAKNVGIWIKYSNFVRVSKQMNLENVIHTDNDIYNYSVLLFDKLWNKEDTIRGLCVSVGNLRNKNTEQLSLFDMGNAKKSNKNEEKLQKVLDDIRNKYGNDKIMYADMLEKKKD